MKNIYHGVEEEVTRSYSYVSSVYLRIPLRGKFFFLIR